LGALHQVLAREGLEDVWSNFLIADRFTYGHQVRFEAFWDCFAGEDRLRY